MNLHLIQIFLFLLAFGSRSIAEVSLNKSTVQNLDKDSSRALYKPFGAQVPASVVTVASTTTAATTTTITTTEPTTTTQSQPCPTSCCRNYCPATATTCTTNAAGVSTCGAAATLVPRPCFLNGLPNCDLTVCTVPPACENSCGLAILFVVTPKFCPP